MILGPVGLALLLSLIPTGRAEPQVLTPKQYAQSVLDESQVWLVNYHDPSCKECYQLKLLVDEASESLEALGFKVGSFDLSQNGAKKVMPAIARLPALKVFTKPPEVNPYTHKNHREGKDILVYGRVELSARKIKQWATDSLPNNVQRVTADDLVDLVLESRRRKQSVAVVLTEREKTSPLLKALAINLQNKLVVAEVQVSDDEKTLQDQLKVESTPALVVFDASKAVPTSRLEEQVHEQFVGNLKDYDKISEFLGRFISEAGDKAGASDGGKKNARAGVPAAAELDAASLNTDVLDGEDAYIVWFRDDREAGDPQWDSFVLKSEGALHAGVFNCSTDASVCLAHRAEQGKGFVSFPFGDRKADHFEVFATAAEAFQHAAASVPDRVRSADFMLEQAMSMAFAEGKYPLLAFTTKSDRSLLLKSLAIKLEDVFRVFSVTDPPEQMQKQLDNPPVPGLTVLFPHQTQVDPRTGQPAVGISHYRSTEQSPFKFHNIVMFLGMMLRQVDPSRVEAMSHLLTGGKPKRSSSTSSSATLGGQATGEVVVVDSEQTWAAACPASSSRLCVVGFTRGANDEEHLNVLRDVARVEAAANPTFTFSVVDGTCFVNFAGAFDVQPPKLPTVVVYSPKKGRVASFVGTFTKEAVRDFLRGVLSGRIPTAPVLHEPAVDTDLSLCGVTEPEVEELAPEDEDMGDIMQEILAEESRQKKELTEQLEREAEERRKAEEDARQSQAAAEAAAAAKKRVKKKKVKRKTAKADEL